MTNTFPKYALVSQKSRRFGTVEKRKFRLGELYDSVFSIAFDHGEDEGLEEKFDAFARERNGDEIAHILNEFFPDEIHAVKLTDYESDGYPSV